MISASEARNIAPSPEVLDEELVQEIIAELDEKIINQAKKGKKRAYSRRVKQVIGDELVKRYIEEGYTAKILGNHTVEICW